MYAFEGDLGLIIIIFCIHLYYLPVIKHAFQFLKYNYNVKYKIFKMDYAYFANYGHIQSRACLLCFIHKIDSNEIIYLLNILFCEFRPHKK